LLNYFEPEGQNFLILESLNSIKENQYPLSIHVLMFIEDGDSFILGRGHESDVRISDISVSRQHARITYKDRKFILEDTGSKFGTLVLAKQPLSIVEKPVILQIGRTLFSLSKSSESNFNDEKDILKSKLSLEVELEDDLQQKLKTGYKESSDGDEEI
jgi:pSer/pThr/pTyr-binding forkhead associated (FHA) protein